MQLYASANIVSVKDCGTVTVAHATPSTTNTKYKTVLAFTCNKGYTLQNQQTLQCAENGKWRPSHNMKCLGKYEIYENVWRAANCSPHSDYVRDFTENHSLNVINVKICVSSE
jgi:hypothetical protein